MPLNDASSLVERSHRNHVMLLYKDENSRADATAQCINEGLEKDMLCVYASVDAFDRWTSSHVSNLSNIILNYEDNIREGNLQIVNFRSHYESALKGGILPFNELKSRLEKTLLERRASG